MFKKKCQRCGSSSVREVIASVLLKIKPFSSSKREIKKFVAKEKCWWCNDCDAFNFWHYDLDHSNFTYTDEKQYKRIIGARYIKDEGMTTEILFK